MSLKNPFVWTTMLNRDFAKKIASCLPIESLILTSEWQAWIR